MFRLDRVLDIRFWREGIQNFSVMFNGSRAPKVPCWNGPAILYLFLRVRYHIRKFLM